MINFDELEFKRCLGSFVSGVTIITMLDANNAPQGVTISSFSSLSLEPPMVAFNLGKESHLYNMALNSKYFSINMLSEAQEKISRKFAERSGNKWDGINYTNGIHGCPILDGVAAYIECLTDSIYDGGDHSIVTGRVVNLKSMEGLKPLVYYMGGYYRLGEKL